MDIRDYDYAIRPGSGEPPVRRPKHDEDDDDAESVLVFSNFWSGVLVGACATVFVAGLLIACGLI